MSRSKIAVAAGVAAAITFGGIAGAAVVSPDPGDADVAVAHHGGPGFGHRLVAGFETLAEVLGVSTGELRDALADGRSIADVAEANGVELQAVIDALVAEANERIDDAVADGHLTAEQADARKASVVDHVTELVDGDGMPFPGLGRAHHHGGERLDVVAEAIGIDEGALLEALRDGRSVAEVAEANDVDPQDVIDALVAEATERITEFVNR